MKKRVHYKWPHNLQPGTKCTKVFPAMKIGYAMTWKHGTTLYFIKNCSSCSERTPGDSGRK